MVTPPYLNSGDTVAIISTARKITEAELQPFLQLLNSWGLNYELGQTINAEDHQFAGDDQHRTADFQKALNDPHIKAIWCARGGYGTVRIIDQLDFSRFIKHPKWILGYSDVTVLHSHIHNFGIETIQANMASEMEKKSEATRSSVKRVLFGGNYSVQYRSINDLNRTGQVSGQLIGGNLSLLYSLLGSPSDIDTTNKILFIEDLEEYLYHIDRMLQNLNRNGVFNKISGLIVGGMTEMNDNTIPFGKSANESIDELISEYDFPVCYEFPAGHVQDNRALIFGREVELKVSNEDIQLKF